MAPCKRRPDDDTRRKPQAAGNPRVLRRTFAATTGPNSVATKFLPAELARNYGSAAHGGCTVWSVVKLLRPNEKLVEVRGLARQLS